MAAVAFHFDYRSPYSYLAMTQIRDLDLTLHRFDVIGVMKRVGNTPTTITCKVKGRYANADEVFHLAHQDRSAWSFLAEVRPYRESW